MPKNVADKKFYHVTVHSEDTGVLVLLIYHRTTNRVWMHAVTKLQPRCIPVHTIREALHVSVVRNLLAYRAVIGCNLTSHVSGYSKITTRKTHTANLSLLNTVTDRAENAIGDAGTYVIQLYSPT